MGTPVSEYVVRRPPPALRDAVVHYCGYRLAGFDPGVHIGLPSPHLTLVITLDDPLSVRWPGGSGRLHAMVGGLHDHPVRIDHDGRQFGIELALTPLGAARCSAHRRPRSRDQWSRRAEARALGLWPKLRL